MMEVEYREPPEGDSNSSTSSISSLSALATHQKDVSINYPTINSDDDHDRTPLLTQPNLQPCEAHENESSAHSSNYIYEEFSSKLTVVCPTCQGKGKLSQSQADSLVALIPVTDKRLKPRKTKLYLALTVILCGISIFMIAFFLLPRSVSVTILDVETVNIDMPLFSTPHIDVQVTYEVRNDNYFDATVNSLVTEISWDQVILNTTTDMKLLVVGGRKTRQQSALLKQYFEDDVGVKVKAVCTTGWKWKLLEKFVTTATVSYMSRSEQVSHTDYPYVQCYNTSFST